jgi:hypothetical protein
MEFIPSAKSFSLRVFATRFSAKYHATKQHAAKAGISWWTDAVPCRIET